MKRLWLCGILATLFSATTVRMYAQEAEGQKEEQAAEEHEESPLSVIFKWLNLAILLGGLGYLLKKPAGEFFDSRKADIALGIKRAQQAQEESAQRMTQIEQRLSQLSTDIAGLRSQAAQEADVEKNKIVSEAQREVDRVVEQSRQEMERIAQGIERQIKASIADVVIERASQKLQTNMTQDDQKRVVVRFIKNL